MVNKAPCFGLISSHCDIFAACRFGLPKREGSMSKFAIRLLTLAMYATSLAVVPMVTPAKAETNGSKYLKKQHRKKIQGSPYIRDDPWSARPAWPVTRPSSQVGAGCPGLAGLHSMTILIEKLQALTGACKNNTEFSSA